jgi:ClpX C4-type zinc finger
MVAGPGVFICADCVELCSEILAIDARPPSVMPSYSGNRVRVQAGRRQQLGDRWRGLLRRLRLWPVAWSEQPDQP